MDSSTNNKVDVPTIDQFYRSLDEKFEFLPEDLKSEFVTEKVIDSVVSRKDDLQFASPRAKKLKAVIQFSHNHLSEERSNSFLKKTVKEYLNQKLVEKEVSPNPPYPTITTIPNKSDFKAPSDQHPLSVIQVATSPIDSKPPHLKKKTLCPTQRRCSPIP